MPVVRCAGQTLDLGPADFVGQGGQARVYARGRLAFKLFDDPDQVPEPARLAALRPLRSPGITAPMDDVLAEDGTRVGYSMPFLAGWMPLITLVPPTYRQRHGLDVRAIAERVLELRDHVARAHAAQALVVDLNELNVLVRPDHGATALIDVDSWQVPGFPATALAESVRDRHATTFSTDTDWFAFAVVTFQLFAGIHPFRGRHPSVKTLDDRMRGHLSVFHPDVVVPPMVDLDGIPPMWRDWYEAVFALGERGPAPTAMGRPAPGRRPRAVLPGTQVEVRPMQQLPGPILGLASWGGRSWVWTVDGLYEDRRRIGPAPKRGAHPFATADGDLAFAHGVDGRIAVRLADGTPVPTDLRVDAMRAHHGTLHARVGATLVELTLQRIANTPVLTSRIAARVAPHATRLFRGVAVTRALGATWVHRLGPATCAQVRIPELDGKVVVDAVHEAGVTVLVTRDAQTGGWTRHIHGPDGLSTTLCDTPDAHLIALPTGIALVQDGRTLELFDARRPRAAARRVTVDLPAPLVVVAGRPAFAHADTVHQVALRR
jgi:hypothetical protein